MMCEPVLSKTNKTFYATIVTDPNSKKKSMLGRLVEKPYYQMIVEIEITNFKHTLANYRQGIQKLIDLGSYDYDDILKFFLRIDPDRPEFSDVKTQQMCEKVKTYLANEIIENRKSYETIDRR